jgi:L-asparaginase
VNLAGIAGEANTEIRSMQLLSGTSQGPVLIVHGGAPSRMPEPEKVLAAAGALQEIAGDCFQELKHRSLCEVVVCALRALEDDPQFNAGWGAAIQSDGEIRVSAAVMDGARQSFSGVINALYVKHPSLIALSLQGRGSRVISQPGTQTLAKELNLPEQSLATEEQLEAWRRRKEVGGFDTVGCVVRNALGQLAAGTSTGGRSFEFPGRVSDSATVAGNYASEVVAVSATGIGEEIVDDALAARLETRCRDGLPLEQAARRCFDEAVARGRTYGWIALHRNGDWVSAHTTPTMSFCVRSEQGTLASSAPQ